MRRTLLCLALPVLLAACGGAEPVWAPDEAVERAVYSHDEPPSITLFTMINNRSGAGGHSAMMVNASQRVIFDPAGTWWHGNAPERNDVHHGITPLRLKFYKDYHARETFHVVMQTKQVSPDVAERALMLVQNYGAVPKAMCGRATSTVLAELPGFETVPSSMYPKRIMAGFAKLPGVTTETIFDDDSDNNTAVLAAQQMQTGAPRGDAPLTQ
ncbi:hypothetical protein Ga0609869_001225 [Rhodovulum iodosum]|uniref:Lipoprotein n=1 Tax=Rhodovulum iodosum TaxID=68291 RepID=A0ABV3XTY8_9RHOB|nr:hypothetical protein [Rhodovulum robiginosum]RSK32716.1 hypothetical protein EJA01_10270 [Rhodovulum robiginosum]